MLPGPGIRGRGGEGARRSMHKTSIDFHLYFYSVVHIILGGGVVFIFFGCKF